MLCKLSRYTIPQIRIIGFVRREMVHSTTMGIFSILIYLTTGTVLNEIFDVMSLKFPNIFLVYETFECTFNTKVASGRVVHLANL